MLIYNIQSVSVARPQPWPQKTFQPVNKGDKDVLYASVLELRQDIQPDLCPFRFADLKTQNLYFSPQDLPQDPGTRRVSRLCRCCEASGGWRPGKPPWKRITEKKLDCTLKKLNTINRKHVFLSAHDTCEYAIDRYQNGLKSQTKVLRAGATYQL